MTTWMLMIAVFLPAVSALAQSAPPSVRRVVTGLDSTGKAVVLIDDKVPMAAERSPNGVGDIWQTAMTPAELSGTDRRTAIRGVQPPKNGTVFRIVQFPPITPEVEKQSLDTMMKAVGTSAPAKGRPPKHPYMHRTRSVDYAIVLSGEIFMMLDDKELLFKAGDVVVQQATNHAWINRSKAPASVAFVLVDSQEP